MAEMKMHIALTLLLFAAIPVVRADIPERERVVAWYHEGGLKHEQAKATGWESQTGSARSLTQVVGKPQIRLVNTPSGERPVLRLDGKSALWAAANRWGTMKGDLTVVALARVGAEAEGFLFDGSTGGGMARAQARGGMWQVGMKPAGSVNSDASDAVTRPIQPGAWQVHAFAFRKHPQGAEISHRVGVDGGISNLAPHWSPLSGLILGGNVAAKRGLECDIAEVLIWDGVLGERELADVDSYLHAKWGMLAEVSAEKQPRLPELPNDPRIFRMTLRKNGQEGVHTYRIPGLATTPKGTLIAVFDIRHNSNADLPANIDVGAMRSTDGGQTWSAMKAIVDFDASVAGSKGNGVGDPAILVDQKTGAIFVAALWSMGGRAWNGSGPGLSPEETGQFVLVKSTDDGLTWSKPINITEQVKRPEWRLCFQGPGNGIQLRNGTLVFPAQFKGADNVPHSCFIASVDGGETWKISPAAIPARPPTSESAIAEMKDGSLLLSMRDESRSGQRLWARWEWSGNALAGKWSEPWRELQDPTCMASLISHPTGKLVYSHPNHPKQREGLTIRASVDGRTWNPGKVLDPGGAMYSAMTVLQDGQIGIVYESADPAGLTYARFPLEWVLEAK